MNIKKIIGTSMIALLVVALSVGMAAAESIEVTPNDQSLQPGQSPLGGTYSTYSIEITGITYLGVNSHTHTIYAVTTAVLLGSGTVDDLRFRFNHSGASSDWLKSGSDYNWTWTDGGDSAASLTLDVMDTGTATDTDTMYQFKIYDGYPLTPTVEDTAHGTAYGTGTPIPEFATLAIPVVALLGLVLFMRRKKD